MIGQGGPRASLVAESTWVSRVVRWWCFLGFPVAIVWVLAGSYAASAAESLRVRLAWGGGTERVWHGRVALSKGALSEPIALGWEADEVGSMWLEPGRVEVSGFRNDRAQTRPPVQTADGYLVIRQRSPKSYDAVEFLVTAPLEATLFVELMSADEPRHPGWVEVRLADLVHGSHHVELDDRGNRLVVRRSPGDDLRVRVARRSLVFGPGETLKFDLQPQWLAVEPGSKVRIKVQLVAARGGAELRSEEHLVTAGQPTVLPIEIPLGTQEGVYDVVISAWGVPKIPLPQAVRSPLGLKPPLAERSLQVLVLQPKASRSALASEGRLSVVQEIDPANPKWWAKLPSLPPIPRWPRWGKEPLGNGPLRTLQHPLGPLAQLAPNAQSGEVSWQAFPLEVQRPGLPHVLEVDYPSDLYQLVYISVIEPNAAGAILPIGLDSGVDHAEEATGLRSRPQWLRHRVIFWPRTKSPIVLIANGRDRSAAAFGKIRVLAGWSHLPRAFSAEEPKPGRLWAGYMDRPLLPENFSATETLGGPSDLSLDDWVTFYEAGTRLVEYLQHVGYNGLMLSVWADGSTIYPSAILEPTPRYDTGALLTTGQDPVRKDVVEMLFRLFDREGLQLVVALEFATPLPELEAILRRGGPEAVGITWIGPDGTAWPHVHPPARGKAPYYNVLHPRVQEAMLAVIRELVSTYGSHPSFAGLGLQLSASGYAQLLGPAWGVDDATIARFQHDTNVRVPGQGPERFGERARFLSHEGRKPWLEWRAARLREFYARVRTELAAVRNDARLYLAATDLFAAPELATELQPALPQKATMADTLLHVGIDARHYGPNDAVVLLRPESIVPSSSLAKQAIRLETQQMPDVDRYFQGLPGPGALFFHHPQEIRIRSFDEKCPIKPCHTWLAAHPVPSAWQNRRRFVHALAALDAQVLFDGGWMLPMGQEDALRDLVAVYRSLPPVRLEPVTDHASPAAGQPVVIRYGTWHDRTYAYVANDASFETRVRVRVEAPPGCRLDPLPGSRSPGPLRRDAEGTYWELELGPYELVAAAFSTPGVRLSKPLVAWPEEVQVALENRLSDLGYRAAALRSPPVLEVLQNPGFEQSAAGSGSIPGWVMVAPPGVTARLDPTSPHEGNQSVYLGSTGPAGGLVSHAFPPPATGRLAISFWLRTADPQRQPAFRVAVEAKTAGPPFYRFAQFGQAGEGFGEVHPIASQWSPVFVEVNDLPLDSLSAVRIRFELLGPGEVWIDDVQLCELAFSRREHKELLRLLAPANVHLQNGQIADCLRVLEGYWPRFLVEYVRLVEAPVASRPEPSASPPAPRPAKDTERPAGILDRLKNFVPQRLRF